MAIVDALLNLFFPRKCVVCGHRLMQHEAHLCMHCLGNIPHTLYHRYPENPLEQKFYGSVRIEKATSYFFYSPDSPYHAIIHEMKYYGHIKLGIYMGRCIATHLMAENSDFFAGIEVIVPVPLAPQRMKQRGYNQCELLAEGLRQVTGHKVVADALIRTIDNPTQTHLTNTERWENVKGIFMLNPARKDELTGKHILLIDDVTTTGATLTACAQTIRAGITDCRISIATLAMAHLT